MEDTVSQAVVLVGGKGTRLRPLTNTRPKPLLPILGKPCMNYALHSLTKAGIDQIFLACGYKAMDIVTALERESIDAEIVFAFEEEPAGTAGAVKLLEEVIDGTFVVASGDVLADVDMKRIIEFHREKGAKATMALTQVEEPQEFGIVGLDDEGRIERFLEKPAPEEVFSNLINAGIYVLEPGVLTHIPEAQVFDFSKDLFPLLLDRGDPIYGTPITGMWKDIGRPEDLLEANLLMADRRGREVDIPDIRVSGKFSGIVPAKSDGILEGPLHLEEGVFIGIGAQVLQSVLGDSVLVKDGAKVEHSLIMDDCTMGEGCKVQDSVLGQGCMIGKGITLRNSVLGDGVRVEGEEVIENVKLD